MVAFPCPSRRQVLAPITLALALGPFAALGQPSSADSMGAPLAQSSRQPTLTLAAAQDRALAANPLLLAAQKERLAWDGTVRQAMAFRNPELSLEGDELRSDGRTEAVRLIQPLDLSGKRRARGATAEAGRDRADASLAARRSELRVAVANAFVDIQEAQAGEQLARSKHGTLDAFQRAVARRVEAGKVSPIEQEKARADAAAARIEADEAAHRREMAQRHLASLWAVMDAPDFGAVSGPFGEETATPDLQAVLSALVRRPEYQARLLAIREQETRLDLERARRYGDVTVAAGVKRVNQTPGSSQASAQNTLMLSVAIPLPLLDRNQGNIYEASQQVDKTRLEADAARNQLQLKATELVDMQALAGRELRALRQDILPASRETVRAVMKGYEYGKFSYLEVLEAQRTYFRNEAQYISASARYERQKHEILEFVGSENTGIQP